MYTALVAQSHKVMKALCSKPFEHIVNSLIGKSGEQNALALAAQPFDDLSDDTGFTCARGAMNEQVVLHLQCSLYGQVRFRVKAGPWQTDFRVEARSSSACHEFAQAGISL